MTNIHKNIPGPAATLVILTLFFTAGCGRRDLTTEVKDARGVDKESPVVFQGNPVGRVEKISATEKGFRLNVALEKPYRKTLRMGAGACPVPANFPLPSGKKMGEPVLLLVGGTDMSQPLLKRGAEVPEVSLITAGTLTWGEWVGANLARAKYLLAGCVTVLILLLLVWKLVRGMFKFLLVLVLAAALLAGAWFVKNGWTQRDIPAAIPEEVQNWLQKSMELFDGAKNTVTDKIKEMKDGF